MRVLLLLTGLMAWGFLEVRAQDSKPALPDVVERWVNVFDDSLDLDEYLDLFTDDVEFTDAETGTVLRGKADLTEFIRPFQHLSSMSATVVGYAVNGDRTYVEGVLRATSPAGEPVVSRGVGVFEVDGARISSFAMYMFRRSIEP